MRSQGPAATPNASDIQRIGCLHVSKHDLLVWQRTGFLDVRVPALHGAGNLVLHNLDQESIAQTTVKRRWNCLENED